MFWYAVGAIVLVVIAYPYLRCLLKRFLLAKRIKTVCEKKGLTLHKTHLLWFLGSKHTGPCDFYIESTNEVFAVKLFGMKRRTRIL